MKSFVAFSICMLSCTVSFAQNQWFEVYSDTLKLNKASDALIKEFQQDISNINDTINLNSPTSVFNAMGPFFDVTNNTINLPIWDLAPKMFQDFCTTVMGNEAEGKELFGLFFNGFYVPHELGHALQFAADTRYDNEYDNEYNANLIGILYWKSKGKTAQLNRCSQAAQKALKSIPNPFPNGENEKEYFTSHYQEFGADPLKYAYVQFSQYLKAYNETKSQNFETYMKSYLGVE